MSVAPTAKRPQRRSPDEFDGWVAQIRERVGKATGPFFLVSPEVPLFDVYLDAFEALAPNLRQVHNCSCCRHFLQRYGGAVTLTEGGEVVPLFWDSGADAEDGVYSGVEHELAMAVRSASVRGVLLDSSETWGQARTGEWTHFGIPSPSRWSHPLKAAHEAAAEKREDHGMLARALAEFSSELAQKAVALLKADALYRSEKVLGVAEWFAALHAAVAGTKNGRLRDNILWRAAATAPPGFAHVRSTMIGTLLEDLASGTDVAEVARRFAEKMHPLQYQRPTAPPSEGNIAQAEKAFAALGAAGALKRRFAKLEDLQTIWLPRAAAPEAPKSSGGVFSHLRPGARADGASTPGAPPATMTWEKFARTVLPQAEQVEYRIPWGRIPLAAFVTAADPNAPPILQWDRPEKRNPVSWYLYNGGSAASDWNLSSGWRKVTGIALSPAHWDAERPMPHQAQAAMLVLDGCRDLRHHRSTGGGLFPELLKSEYHGLRRTLEAHIQSAEIAGKDEATACGLHLSGQGWDCVVRALSGGIWTEYRLDRWD